MSMKNRYIVSAVQNGHLIEDSFNANSRKQAWFLFGKKYGFNMYDFKVLGEIPYNIEYEQLKFNI